MNEMTFHVPKRQVNLWLQVILEIGLQVILEDLQCKIFFVGKHQGSLDISINVMNIRNFT